MRAATLFSGIGAPEQAMPGWQWLWHAEIEPFPSAVMAVRHPASVNLGDVTSHDFCERACAIGRPDVVVFGSPCQSFSVAGQRLGLDDPRGNLALVALGVLARLEPRWFVFENVPGLLSSDGGRDFGVFLRAVEDSRYCAAWAVLDAQYFGVAQRRQRVFVVGHLADWRAPAAVLFEPESVRGHSPTRREARQDVAPTLGAGPGSGGRTYGTDADSCESLVAMTLNGKGGSGRSDGESETFVTHSLRADGFDASEDGTGRGTPLVPVAFDARQSDELTAVRRLTPVECERLQGFPDDYTNVAYRGKPAADGPRYRAIGNSMAVPVVRWILARIAQVDALQGHRGQMPLSFEAVS
jgi:DNA (cytosine-5)-methyltransferase 1